MARWKRAMALPGMAGLAVVLGLLVWVSPAEAQYFGRNKVQYEDFDFRVMDTPHFDLHYYPVEQEAARDMASLSEVWYDRFNALLSHGFENKPIILYADHPDFQQTNVISGFISEATGGVTESLRNRVVLPLTGIYAENNHVLGHELVHVFQYDIAQGRGGGGLGGMARLPLWVIEGMAEYLSVGRVDAHTAMWLRAAILLDRLPTITELTTDPRFFPYRYGQAVWAYIGGRWGDRAVPLLYRRSLLIGWERAVKEVLGVTTDELSSQWIEAVRAAYLPLMQGRVAPRAVGRRVTAEESGAGEMNLGPALSPEGRYVAFFSDVDLFSIDLFLADARTGEVLEKLTSSAANPHFEALAFLRSAGTWSPDGQKFAFVVFDEGDNALAILDVASRDVEQKIRVDRVGEIRDPAWSPDGREIAFSGNSGGVSDLYVLDVETSAVRQLTNDQWAQLQPAWSPDGRTIAFMTDRTTGADRLTALTAGRYGLATLDVASGRVTPIETFTTGKAINPRYSPDGSSLYFVADPDGFQNVFRVDLRTGELYRVTNVATGVSGVTATSPTLTIAQREGTLAFSVFENNEYNIYALEGAAALGEPYVAPAVEEVVTAENGGAVRGGGVPAAAVLPPIDAARRSAVARALAEPLTDAPSAAGFEVTKYEPRISLDYVGAQAAGVAVSRFGFGIGGGAAFYFSDMLNRHTIGAMVQANGTLKDVAGQAVYQNAERRWSWFTGAAHIPYLSGFTSFGVDENGRVNQINQHLQRVFVDQALVGALYPFSMTRRVEASVGYTHYGFDEEVLVYDVFGGAVRFDRREDVEAPAGLHLAQAAAALVGDWSFFGFTSPIMGGRYRFEVEPTIGSFHFTTALADMRRYFLFAPVTLAVRGLHYGRYGRDADDEQRLAPLFLGYETFIRGYSFDSFEEAECEVESGDGSSGTCPVFDRLIGSKLAVANLELRIPLIGTERFGLLDFGFIPTEIAPFIDAGVAWTGDEGPVFELERESLQRIPVFSAGVAARFNVLGYLVLEAYWAYPFQRPKKGGHFGFQLAPGW